ncbi:HAD-IA family hydrolase [Pseudomonas sp.]|uniref:HAD-IA family hydrolase n=1 Tax=Pseudomonas sp. TaxID=306 RepID=UPI002629BA7C|nr:HAD-IA family hydrolase [Pseudomonas sp.]
MSSRNPAVFTQRYRAFLFDMDGTLLNSIAAAERVWSRWAERHGLDLTVFLTTIHGARAIDTITRQALPGVDPEAEAAWITEAELNDVEGIVAIPGAVEFLNRLPADQWALVTSAPKALALRRMAAAGICMPAVMVTAEDVVSGKPDPACYVLGAQRLGVPVQDCLVFEDAAVGIRAAEAAGADVMVVTSTHLAPMATEHACINGYEGLRVLQEAGGLLTVRERVENQRAVF